MVEASNVELARLMLKTGAVKFGVFTLTSGRLSPYYVDLRVIPSYPSALRRVVDMYQRVVEEDVGLDVVDRVAGVPTAGMPFASIIAYNNMKPFLYVRKEVKPHGRERRIEGVLKPGDRVLIVDDLATTGKSGLSAVEAIQAEGGVVEHVVVLVDREEGAAEALAERGVKLHPVIGIGDLADRLVEIGAITEEQRREILAQREKKKG